MLRRSIVAALFVLIATCVDAEEPWKRHTIDNSSRGADGVRPRDVNADGLPDLCTGWEEGGVVRVYLHPGHASVREAWPAVTVGDFPNVEDAVFADLNEDGAFDVVISCEGKQRTTFVAWAPVKSEDYLNPEAWRTDPLVDGQCAKWMFALPWPGKDGSETDIINGSKGEMGSVGRYVRNHDKSGNYSWFWEQIAYAGWIMSLVSEDINGDGHADVLLTERKGRKDPWDDSSPCLDKPGIYWIDMANNEKPGTPQLIGGSEHEVMFLDVADIDQDGDRDILTATRDAGLLLFLRDGTNLAYEEQEVPLPDNAGTGKSVRAVDVDMNGSLDLVFSCENAQNKHGVMWLKRERDKWVAHPISGDQEGTKFDLLQLIDLDGDGDLDVLTCEERENLGVIWYENPTR
ncbi:FG-GAP repeat domain-containing protein [Bremerella sp. T1]|uniref:FG-GAP repeat domain-containing protein n=1 Tax=Bremerella sp. TYQ1 TaxID=3119568 RepID=UPI001CCE21FE|nr:VCBS repeat-containing protein [Bremerella volcania]UBM34702.1 VCBS repeat-containing protein [Bremerella volcania]